MLTILTVQNQESNKWYRRILNFIRGNILSVEFENARGVVLKHITYKHRTGKINWNKVDDVVGPQRNHLICAENILLPEEMGYKRFDNKEFKSRLVTNLSISVVSKMETPNKIKIGIFDPNGESADFLPSVVKYTDNIVVVTDNFQGYKYEVDCIYEEMGATVQISDNRVNLIDCDFVIAPEQIKERLPLSSDTIVLTSDPPSVCTTGLLYYDYYIKLPKKFDVIKPKELSDVYFAGALYSKAGQFQLGSIVPISCKNNSSAQTVGSICSALQKYAD